MEDKRTISLCIPSFQRVDMTLQAFENVYLDDRISEIVIVDDASDLEIFNELKEFCELIPKIKLYRNLTNQGCYRNKMTALAYATNDWCILLDSDNIIDKSYIDGLYYESSWNDNMIYTPCFAKPTFDFRQYMGTVVMKENVAKFIDLPLFETMLNAANYFVNRSNYIKVWDANTEPMTSDSIYMCMRWLEAGNKIYVHPLLQYEHRIHKGSHYINNVHRTKEGFHESILQKLKDMA